MSDETKVADPQEDRTDPLSREHREGVLGDLAGRIIRVGVEVVAAGAEKLREKGETAASLTARGKDEVMTLVTREIRSQVEKLKVAEALRAILDDYTLEIRASIRLKAAGEGDAPGPAPGVDLALVPREEPAKKPTRRRSRRSEGGRGPGGGRGSGGAGGKGRKQGG